MKEKPGKDQKEGLDEDITSLLSQLYANMYDEDIRTNTFINNLLDGIPIYNRYYFNSEKIEKEAPYIESTIYTLPSNYTFWLAYVVSDDYDFVIDTVDLFDVESEELFMLSKNNIELNSLKDLTKDIIEDNEIIFYYHGKEISLEDIDLSKYENVAVTLKNGINPEVKKEVVRDYLPTIYESFPEQRIGETELKNNTY